MSKDILGSLVRVLITVPEDRLGLVQDVALKLSKSNDDGDQWVPPLKKFLRKEPCWVDDQATPVEIQPPPAPIAKRTLAPWKTIKIGGKPIEQVTSAITEKGDQISDYARDIMGKPAFKVAREEESIDLIILTLADLGFTENPRTDEFMTKEFLAKWSAEHLTGQVIELCHPEVGPQLRLQYQDQPNVEVLWIAMERISDSDGDPLVFLVKRLAVGDRWLRTAWTNPDYLWALGNVLVFRLRKVQN